MHFSSNSNFIHFPHISFPVKTVNSPCKWTQLLLTPNEKLTRLFTCTQLFWLSLSWIYEVIHREMLLYFRRYPLYIFIVVQVIFFLLYYSSKNSSCFFSLQAPKAAADYEWVSNQVSSLYYYFYIHSSFWFPFVQLEIRTGQRWKAGIFIRQQNATYFYWRNASKWDHLASSPTWQSSPHSMW